ncbi:MAG TPA: site-2 protease family protein [Candidatus Binatia bacterium]|jgi:Zn-dependent protease
MNFNPAIFALWVLPFLIAVVFHEWAHGYVAKTLGDDTASVLGRLTLNPLAHIDPIGTLALPALLMLTGAPFMFGWAKPVPISFGRLRNPRRDMVLVAAAGPAMNLALAAASALLLGYMQRRGAPDGGGFQVAQPLAIMCNMSLQLNVVLAVFNMLPIPPLDGGRVAVGLLPRDLAWQLARLEPYGFMIVMMLLVTHVLDFVLAPAMHAIVRLLGVLV